MALIRSSRGHRPQVPDLPLKSHAGSDPPAGFPETPHPHPTVHITERLEDSLWDDPSTTVCKAWVNGPLPQAVTLGRARRAIAGLPSDGKGLEWTLGWTLPDMLQVVTPWTSAPAPRTTFPEEGSSRHWPQGLGRPWCLPLVESNRKSVGKGTIGMVHKDPRTQGRGGKVDGPEVPSLYQPLF